MKNVKRNIRAERQAADFAIGTFSKTTNPMIMFNGIYDENYLIKMDLHKDPNIEGYVIRLASGFKLKDFASSIAKWVRVDHIQSEEHWMHTKMVPNGLIKIGE